MTPSKFHRKGFSYIEVMFALALLGIFGSTLFVAQSGLFKKIYRSHVELCAQEKIDLLVSEYKMQIKQAELAEQSLVVPEISKTYDNPEMSVSVSGKYIQLVDEKEKKKTDTKKSQQKNVTLQVSATAEHEFGKQEVKLLLYKPQPEKQSS